MADSTLFTENGRVRAAVDSARTACASNFVSDLIDDDGNQYVDFVMEGGGVLGIALTGYTYVLEQAGIRFLGVGGTSAGSINALMIAALGTPNEAKSERLVSALADMPMESFIDGDGDFAFQLTGSNGVVPEPASMTLIGMGLVGFAVRRKLVGAR